MLCLFTLSISRSMHTLLQATPHIMELLEESLSWEFDIFKLEEITEKRPLLYLGMEMFRRFNVFATLNIDENVCKGWLAIIEANYHSNNSYHNSTHAADVMQVRSSISYILISLRQNLNVSLPLFSHRPQAVFSPSLPPRIWAWIIQMRP